MPKGVVFSSLSFSLRSLRQQPHHADSSLSVLQALRPFGDEAAHGGEVVEQAAGGAIWGVHGAQEAPSLWHQLAHRRGTQLGKVCPSVDRPEMGQVSADSTSMSDTTSGNWYGLMQDLSLKDVVQTHGYG